MSDNPVLIGIDEAGRGPVIGPLVLALVAANPEVVREWKTLGVRDSKKISRQDRQNLFKIITHSALYWDAVSLPAWVIDRENLSFLCESIIVYWLKKYSPAQVFIDAMTTPEAIPQWIQRLQQSIRPCHTRIQMEVDADEHHPIVSAASIVAKVLRDESLLHLKELYRIPGWGYPSEKNVVSYLHNLYRKSKSWPPWVRSRWKTCQQIESLIQRSSDPVQPPLNRLNKKKVPSPTS